MLRPCKISASLNKAKELTSMSALTLVTLKDGSQVFQGTLVSVTTNVIAAAKENPIALYDLAKKCSDASYRFTPKTRLGDSKTTLRKFGLIDSKDEVPDTVKKIVINSLEQFAAGAFIQLVNPLKTEQVSVVKEDKGVKSKL
jgi:hypothetical protein